MSEKKGRYKYCIVPKCKNTTVTTPDKMFISLPKNLKVRNLWQQAMRRDNFVSVKGTYFCCEDHFNLEEDLENYMYIKTMKSGKVIMKAGAAPHIFQCQNDPPIWHTSKRRSLSQRKAFQKSKATETINITPAEFINTATSLCDIVKEEPNLASSMEESIYDIKDIHMESVMDNSSTAKYDEDERNAHHYTVKNEDVKVEYDTKFLEIKEEVHSFDSNLWEKNRSNAAVKESHNNSDTVKDENITVEYDDKNTELNTDINSVQCNSRDKHYQLDTNLNVHRKVFPSDCKICRKTVETVDDLKRHKKICFDENVLKCEICEKNFKQLNHLEKHNKAHFNEHLYQCEVCGRTFKQSGTFNRHVKVHFDERPYRCNTCQKAFRRYSHLEMHIRIHTKERPYKCNVCPKTFSRSSTLNEHRTIHCNEKLYKCNICGKTFNRSSNLGVHKKIHFK